MVTNGLRERSFFGLNRGQFIVEFKGSWLFELQKNFFQQLMPKYSAYPFQWGAR
jgi:hypothetical protein